MQKIKVLRDGVEVEVEVVAVYETQEDLDKALKSANSQGKGEILKTLGVTSVEDAKTKMGAQTEVDTLKGTLKTLQVELEKETHRRIANEIGVKPELVDKAIILAKASMTEGKDFKTILEAEAKAIGAVIDKTKQNVPPVIGSPKTKEQLELDKAEAEEMNRLRGLDPYNPK